MPTLHLDRPIFGTAAKHPKVMRGACTGRHMAVVRAQAAGTAVEREKPAWTGDGLASKVVNWAINTPPLYNVMKVMAKSTMQNSAEQRGVMWRQHVATLAADPELKAIKEEIEDKSIEYPSYYLKPFHAYEQGNLEWLAAYEVEPATFTMCIRTFKDHPEWSAQRCFEELRTRITDHIKAYQAQHGAPPPQHILDVGCSTGISTRWLAQQYPGAQEVVGLDASPYFLAVAELDRRRGGGVGAGPSGTPSAPVRYVHRVIERSGLPAASQDLVTFNFIIHECPAQAITDFVAESARLLKRGGVVAFIDNNPKSKTIQNLPPMLATLLKSTEPWSDEYYAFDVEACLRAHGFSHVVTVETDHRHRAVMGVKA